MLVAGRPRQRQTGASPLDPEPVLTEQCLLETGEATQVAGSGNTSRIQARNDLAWAIAVGGIATIAFAGLVVGVWYFAATLFLIFAGVLLGVALYAMSNLLRRFTVL